MNKSQEQEGEWESFFIKWSRRVRLYPKDIILYKKALTHPSYWGDTTRQNKFQREFELFEFLGDAVLSLAIAEYIFINAPGFGPGELTLVKSRIVSSRVLANVARRLGIQNLLILGRSEELANGREKDSILEDALESFIGCIYIEKGWEKTKRFIHRVFDEELSKIYEYATKKDSKSEFQEFCQKEGLPLPTYVVLKEEGPDHRKHFQVALMLNNKCISLGEGNSKKSASQSAAEKALSLLRNKKRII